VSEAHGERRSKRPDVQFALDSSRDCTPIFSLSEECSRLLQNAKAWVSATPDHVGAEGGGERTVLCAEQGWIAQPAQCAEPLCRDRELLGDGIDALRAGQRGNLQRPRRERRAIDQPEGLSLQRQCFAAQLAAELTAKFRREPMPARKVI